jgi:hypothetical protein
MMNHPKLKKLDLLETNTPAERDLVKHVVASMSEKLGEEKTVKVLNDLNQANVKLVDFVNAMSGTTRNVPDAPVMLWNKEATITETGRVDLGGGREAYPAPRINWSKVKK